ncbi:MAG: AbrB/MazE/SpoVT family DNA-binding domain-containing protein [Bacteroidales bacterium]
MKTKIIRIGTSLGLILPSPIIKGSEIQLGTQIEITENDNKEITIKKVAERRKGWAEAFKRCKERGGDETLFPDFFDLEMDAYL